MYMYVKLITMKLTATNNQYSRPHYYPVWNTIYTELTYEKLFGENFPLTELFHSQNRDQGDHSWSELVESLWSERFCGNKSFVSGKALWAKNIKNNSKINGLYTPKYTRCDTLSLLCATLGDACKIVADLQHTEVISGKKGSVNEILI